MNQLHSNPRCKFLLWLLFAAAAGLAAYGLAQTNPAPPQLRNTQSTVAAETSPSIEVAVIKPHDPNSYHNSFRFFGGRFSLDDQTVSRLIVFAYAINRRQIVDAPAWVTEAAFDIDGKCDVENPPSVGQQQMMVRKLLAERFGLQIHREKREMSVYALQIAKGGPRLKPAAHPDQPPSQVNEGHGMQTTRSFTSAAISDFILTMQYFVDRPIVDETGLNGRYDIELTYTYADATSSDPDAPPPLFTALQEQLGLKFQPTKAATDVLVIDHVERPSPN